MIRFYYREDPDEQNKDGTNVMSDDQYNKRRADIICLSEIGVIPIKIE